MEGDDQSRAAASGSPSSCSRMRRMLFRRTRSETEDRMRNSRLTKGDSITGADSTPEPVHSRLNFTPSSVLEEASAVPVVALTRLHSLMPRSPPPPYDTNSDVRSGNISQLINLFRNVQRPYQSILGPIVIAERITSFGQYMSSHLRRSHGAERT